MHKQIFVNLPVADLPRTQAFFGQLGFTFNAQFTNDKAACMVIGENIYAMLLTTDFSAVSPASRSAMPGKAPKSWWP